MAVTFLLMDEAQNDFLTFRDLCLGFTFKLSGVKFHKSFILFHSSVLFGNTEIVMYAQSLFFLKLLAFLFH